MKAPKVPRTPTGKPLAQIHDGRLLLLRSTGGELHDCPYCGKSNITHAGPSGSVGFRIASWKRHTFTCYERALLRQGYVIGMYLQRYLTNRVEKLKPENVRTMAKLLKVPLKDIPVKAPAKIVLKALKHPKPKVDRLPEADADVAATTLSQGSSHG